MEDFFLIIIDFIGSIFGLGEIITKKDDPRNIPFKVYAPIILFMIVIFITLFFIYA